MRQLWLTIPPFLSDTFGFQTVLDGTKGMGILDDCSEYKGRSGRLDAGRGERQKHMVSTGIRLKDTVGGTGKKIKEAADFCVSERKPDFIALATGPVSAMMGTDLEAAAEVIAGEHQLPVAWVELTGHKYYDIGISRTLEALAKLLVIPGEVIPGTCGLLGGNRIDCGENTEDIWRWAEEEGCRVISKWGDEETTENLKRVSRAEINVVTAAAGISLAKYLKKTYGTPYITGVPYGETWSRLLGEAMRTGRQPEMTECREGDPEILIIGEQLTANAVRETLIRDFYKDKIQTATFFQLEREAAYPWDRRLLGEGDLRQLMNEGNYKIIIGAAEFKRLWDGRGRFIVLPHGAVSMNSQTRFPDLTGCRLNHWLKAQGIMEG